MQTDTIPRNAIWTTIGTALEHCQGRGMIGALARVCPAPFALVSASRRPGCAEIARKPPIAATTRRPVSWRCASESRDASGLLETEAVKGEYRHAYLMASELVALYETVCRCPSTVCVGVKNDPDAGWPPRGFYTEATGPVRLLVVCKNPGHVLEDERAL